MSNAETAALTPEEKNALCAVAYNIHMDDKHQALTRDLIRRGFVKEETVWSLTEAGEAALRELQL